MGTKERKHWISYLRVFATIGVVIAHVSVHILDGPITSLWWVVHIYDSLVRSIIPIFVMISGVLLLPSDMELGTFFNKRFKRVLLPFVFWSLIYILYDAFNTISSGEPLSFLMMAKMAVFKLFKGASFHLWYIYMLIGLLLFTPVLSKWIRNAKEKEILYFLGVWALTLILSKIGLFSELIPVYFTGFIGYYVLGYYLSIKPFNSKIISLVLYFTGVMITIVGTYYMTIKTGHLDHTFYISLTPNVLLAAIGIFLLAKQTLTRKPPRWMEIIDQNSYGIYLCHVLFLSVMARLGLSIYDFGSPVLGIIILTLICSAVSLFAVWGIKKLPFGNSIAG